MPTAYLKKLAKLNRVSVNKIEKFWSQAKEIAKSEGQGKAWGLITSIFQNKLKKEGYKVSAFYEPDRLDDDTQKHFDNLNHTKELTKENTPTLLAMLKHSYFKNVRDHIKQIWARSMNSERTANQWLLTYHPLIVECEKLAIEPKVCARMCYIKYHKENPYTKHLNKNNDVSFNTLKKEALQYFEGLRKWKEDEELLNELNKRDAASMRNNVKNKYHYNGRVITASSKEEAIKKIVAYTFGNRTVEDVKKYLKEYSPIENKYFSNIYLYKKEITRLLKEDGQFTIIANKRKLSGLCHLCAEAGVSAYDAFKYISNNF